MEKIISFSNLLQLKPAFTKHHPIFFKEGSDAFHKYGHSVHGRLLAVTSIKKMNLITEENHKFKIDAPRFNNHNKNLNGGLSSELYFIGVGYNELDLLATYPNIEVDAEVE